MTNRTGLLLLIGFLTSCKGDFESISKDMRYPEKLMERIVPRKSIEYWQIDYIEGLSPKEIFSSGNRNVKKQIKFRDNNIMSGLFTGCQPGYCSYRIVYIENGSWNFVNNENQLKSFIGSVDNEFEAFLIAEAEGYNVDDDIHGNGFERTDFGYKLIVMKYKLCPISKESFLLNIYKNGELEVMKSYGYYLQKSDCIVY